MSKRIAVDSPRIPILTGAHPCDDKIAVGIHCHRRPNLVVDRIGIYREFIAKCGSGGVVSARGNSIATNVRRPPGDDEVAARVGGNRRYLLMAADACVDEELPTEWRTGRIVAAQKCRNRCRQNSPRQP